MNIDLTNLGQFLADQTKTHEERNEHCELVISLSKAVSDIPAWATAQAACHLGYRALDGWYDPTAAITHLCWADRVLLEKDKEQVGATTCRWLGSVRMAGIYLDVHHGEPPITMIACCRMMRPQWMLKNPSGAVNCCRSMALGMAMAVREKNQDAALKFYRSSQEIFSMAAQHWNHKTPAFCFGHELVQAARSLHTCMALLPLAGLPYSGEAYDAETIIQDTQDDSLMQSSLRSILCPE